MSDLDVPPAARPLGELADRLAMEGLLRETRIADRPAAVAEIGEVSVTGVSQDSRTVARGALFVAVAGLRADGHDHAAAAVAAGAAALIVEQPLPGLAVPQLVVGATRRALASAAAWWFGDPSRSLTVVGITGTDGKTTTAYLAVAALEAAGRRTGMIGTIATRIGGRTDEHVAHATTPEAPELQAALRAMVDGGDSVAVIETTSHGLALDRVASVAYDIAILTNLTHEHLELHGSWEAYRDAKLSLFARLTGPAAVGIVNADDPAADSFASVARQAGARVITYGSGQAADIRATRIREDTAGLHAAVRGPFGDADLDLRLAGRFNVHNALAVVALGEAMGLDPAAVRRGLEALERVPGRMERIDRAQPFGVVVDFAHSPASLEAVLDLLAPVAAERGGGVIAVFGSAGERDTAKRPLMGRIAGERCRLVVVTDEDPRGEDRLAILDAIAGGAESAGRRRDQDLMLIADRRRAIEVALAAARPGDVVLLAGKGHERSIIGADGETPWDERQVAEDVLAAMGYPGPT